MPTSPNRRAVRLRAGVAVAAFAAVVFLPHAVLAVDQTRIASPDGSVQFTLLQRQGRLHFAVSARNQPVLEPGPMQFTLDGDDLTKEVEIHEPAPYQINESYPWYGWHSRVTNHCNGATFVLKHAKSGVSYTLDLRVFNDSAAFRFLVPGGTNARVPDEATTFLLPAGSTVWYHDLEGHYEGVHVRKDLAQVGGGDWAAPPVTFKLPAGAGYAAITEAGLAGYSGMALQADGHRGLRVRLGHSHPASHPFLLRYGTNEAQRLAQPAAITGPITTPWRVVMVGPDLNTLVNCDALPNLCPAPDPKLFPKGSDTEWIRPGRAVWRYLDGGGSNTIGTIKEFTRLAGELGFEHNIVEGFWTRWSDAELKDLVAYANARHVGIWLWKHSRSLHDPQARHEFFQHCHDLGITGAKIDFFDHEAKEVIDLYESCHREAAQYHLLLDFHGANKPTGEARTWPNELTREAVKGMEASRMTNRATHGVTLPFTRLLAGPAEYTPVLFGPRRGNTTWAHQIASPVILSAPLLTYGINPSNILANPCVDMLKSIPSVWDETIVLPPSEIGELAVFARRTGQTWFLAVMNGVTARKIKIPLSFLGKGRYRATLVRDTAGDAASPTILDTPLQNNHSLTIELREGGGFLARFRKE